MTNNSMTVPDIPGQLAPMMSIHMLCHQGCVLGPCARHGNPCIHLELQEVHSKKGTATEDCLGQWENVHGSKQNNLCSGES